MLSAGTVFVGVTNISSVGIDGRGGGDKVVLVGRGRGVGGTGGVEGFGLVGTVEEVTKKNKQWIAINQIGENKKEYK